ncbi:MAG TPA: SIS domain-containing protein [Phycisphaerales bacterium]|nr:SIS domain-containing protein [Phycisphaerales bacterium]
MNQTIKDTIELHKKLIAEFEAAGVETVIQTASIITDCFRRGGCVYLCGNGGSAADCQHIAGELIGRFRRQRRALPAVALSTDTSVITCIGNDYSFEQIFSRQVEALVEADDILWAFSTSGSSPNIVAAAQLAKEKGAKIIAFTGRPGSTLEQIADLCLCVDTQWTSSVQEVHQLAYHIICNLIEQNFCNESDI